MATLQAGTKSVRKGAPPVAAKATPKGKPEQAAAKAGSAIVMVKKSALSVDVGPKVLATMAKITDVETDIQNLGEELKAKRYDMLAQLTAAIVKAAKADDSIDLSATFDGDSKRMTSLNDRLGIALGFREIVQTSADKNGIVYDKVVTSQSCAKWLPLGGETPQEKETDEYKRKEARRGNFMTQVKKCAQAAATIIDKAMNAKYDQKNGTLLVSGPAIKKQFGQDSVLLNEKKTVGEGNDKVELNEKPSFAALAKMGAVAAGAAVLPKAAGTPGTRTATIVPAAKMDQAVLSIAKSLTLALEKHPGKASDVLKNALDAVTNAIELKLSQA